uniref:TNF receptor superfamily member 10d n=1 Tax=Aotus nancymaae TaxID=37293 RepID=A0A2K5CUG3_AOTNA
MAPGPKTLLFAIFLFAVQLLGQVDCLSDRQDEVPQLTVAPQEQKHSLKEEECPAGSHRSEYTGACIGCTEGLDYTNGYNNLPACLLCTVCKSDEEELSPCTTTRDTECQCKPGTFRNDSSTEVCRKCSTGCPRGMVKVSDCVPWSDIDCVDESAASSTGKTPAAEETVTTSPGTPASPFPTTVIIVVLLLVFSLVVARFVWKTSLWKKVLSCLKGICSGAGGDPDHVDRVFFWRSCPSRGPEAEDNVCNEDLSNRESQHTQIPEQEIEGQELRELTCVTVESPEEPQRLLGQAEAEWCQRRRLQVPVNDADPTEINTLLDASATLEEGHAKETIQDQLVGAEKLLCEEGDGGSATSYL